MLKIKSNTNEFTIIFSEKIGKKINAEKFSVPAPSFFLLQHLFFSSCFSGWPPFASAAVLSFFPAFLLLSFLPYVFKVQPFTCCSLTQPKKPKRFSVFQPKRFSASVQPLFLLLFSALFFSVAAQKYYIQPKTFLIFLQLKILFQFSPKISVQLQWLLLFVSFLLAFLFCL